MMEKNITINLMDNTEKNNIIEKIKFLSLEESYNLFNELSKLGNKIFIEFIEYTQDNEFWEKIIDILISNKILIMPMSTMFGCYTSICSDQFEFWKIFFNKMYKYNVMNKIAMAPEYFFDSFKISGYNGNQYMWEYMIKHIKNDEFWIGLSKNSRIIINKWNNHTLSYASYQIKNKHFWYNIFRNINVKELNDLLLFTNDEYNSLWIKIIKNVKSTKMWKYFAKHDYLIYWCSRFNYEEDPCDGGRLTLILDDKSFKKKKLRDIGNIECGCFEFSFWELAYYNIKSNKFWKICSKKYSIILP